MKYGYRLILVLLFDFSSAMNARFAFESGSTLFLFFSMASLVAAGYFFIRLMENNVGIIVNAVWIALGAITVTVGGYLLFGEKISWMQGVGMAVIVVGLILMEVYSTPEDSSELELSDLVAKEGIPKDLDDATEPEIQLKITPSNSIKTKDKILMDSRD
jgi:multidrug transporter EmrE-like cation transporter